MVKRVMFGLCLLVAIIYFLAPSVLGETAEEAEKGAQELAKFGLAIGSGIGLGLAALGGALGQGRIAGSAMDGIARNPEATDRMFVPMIIGLALVESLVLYTFIIAIFLQGKI